MKNPLQELFILATLISHSETDPRAEAVNLYNVKRIGATKDGKTKITFVGSDKAELYAESPAHFLGAELAKSLTPKKAAPAPAAEAEDEDAGEEAGEDEVDGGADPDADEKAKAAADAKQAKADKAAAAKAEKAAGGKKK